MPLRLENVVMSGKIFLNEIYRGDDSSKFALFLDVVKSIVSFCLFLINVTFKGVFVLETLWLMFRESDVDNNVSRWG